VRKVEVTLTCDACMAWEDRENADGVEVVPVVGDVALDLCPPHRDATASVVALILQWASTPAEPTRNRRGGKRARTRRANAEAAPARPPVAPRAGYLPCPLCEYHGPSVGALGAHFRAAHGLTSRDVYGDVCPLCQWHGSAQGLGLHGKRAHGVDGVGTPALFAAAEQAGDPHGVIASRARELASRAAT
jgi:hypothetical protein